MGEGGIVSIIYINPYQFAAVGSSLWTPANITTALWLDAADESTVTTVSGAVSQWNDKSGNELNIIQATAANRPAYSTASLNSKNTVAYDGSDFLSRTAVNIARNIGSSLTYAVAKGATSGTQSIALITNNSVQARQYIYFAGNNLAAGGRRLDSDGFQLISNSATHAGAWVLAGSRFLWSSSDLYLYQNGNEVASSLAFQSNGNTSDTASTITVGNNAENTQALNGNIAELLVVTPDPSIDTRQRIEGYLAHKWDLTANLPSDHPFKSAAPTV